MGKNDIKEKQNIGDDPKPIIKTSVRGMVEFVLRCGDIDNRRRSGSDNAMQEGSRIHRMIQRRMGGAYQAEVNLSYIIEEEAFDLILDGRADGIFPDTYEEYTDLTFIDEIKGVYRDVRRMRQPVEIHLSQAKCYAAIYARQQDLEYIGVQMTYCNIDTEEIKRFREVYNSKELFDWFVSVCGEYKKWALFKRDFREIRQASIRGLKFPYEYREGQKELAEDVYRTIYHKKRLFIEAPTGVGKTISTIYPAVMALGQNKGEQIFYLTAKNLTGVVAEDTFNLLRQQGLRMKTVRITAKEKICPLDEVKCNPVDCPYAKGHFDRINDAMYDLLTTSDEFSRENIMRYSNKHMVCPFEFSLDMSLFSDGIICDYNYVFDPNVYLRRFFADGVKGNYLFLVDEAHNLVDRAREMYSATIYKASISGARKLAAPFDASLAKSLEGCNRVMLDYLRDGLGVIVRESVDDLIIALTRVAGCLDEFLEEDEGSLLKEELLDFYFEVRHFLNMAELLDENYVIYTEASEDDFFVRLFCVNPYRNLMSCLEKGRSTIFFSATLLPVTYYMDLLSGDRKDYAVYAKSAFDNSRRGVYIGVDVSSRYTRRGPKLYNDIASYIMEISSKKSGNYMVFFPSYAFMSQVYDRMLEMELGDVDVVCQQQTMSEIEREEFLNMFRGQSYDNIMFDIEQENKTLIGMCVLGGIFSEGIDLTEDALIGAIIVGTGLPQIGPSLEILKEYFDQSNGNRRGFDYAYRIPGMNKVLQSAGRVIRTMQDRGIVVLLDDRFMNLEYRRDFPREWENIVYGNKEKILEEIERFWNVGL